MQSKLEFHKLKEQNDQERAELQREEKLAAKFKFKKMEKAKDFLPSLHTRGFLQIENVTPIDSGLPYISAREREALTLPRRSSDYSKLFAPHRTTDAGDYF